MRKKKAMKEKILLELKYKYETPAKFKCPNLERAISKVIYRGDIRGITLMDLEMLFEAKINKQNITSLEGLQHCINLYKL